MLPSSQRLSVSLFSEVMKTGRLIHSTFFLIRVKKAGDTTGLSRFAFSVPKKVASTAVLRNKIRRRGYSAIRAILSSTATIPTGFHFVFISKPEVKKATLPQLQADITSSLKKLF